MKRVKDCNGCKALYQSQYSFTCGLGFELSIVSGKKFIGVDIKKVSPKYGKCPKPTTYNKMFKCTCASIRQGADNGK